MGNNFCSICNNQTSIIEINQFSFNLVNNKIQILSILMLNKYLCQNKFYHYRQIINPKNTIINDIITTIPDIKTTFLENINYPKEKICEDNNKIYYNGICICDINKGYYSINYEKYNNKCFKKDELPKNVFFNYKTQLYELCYDNCESCI